MATKITDHYFEYGTAKYFRGKAENVEMGSYGKKSDPFGPRARLEVQNKVKSEHLDSRVRYITTTDVDWNRATKADVEANGGFKFFGLGGKAAVGGSYEKAKNADLKLIKFAIDAGPLRTMLNKDADGARNYLADEGADGRIVSEVWVALEAELSEHFSTAGSISASVNGGGNGLDITAEGGKHGSQTITLSRGTTFAYLLHKVKDWSNGKTQIEDLKPDYWGM